MKFGSENPGHTWMNAAFTAKVMRPAVLIVAVFAFLVYWVDGSPAQSNFEAWSALARSDAQTPVDSLEGDHVESWVGPDKQTVRLVVREPRATRGPEIVINAIPGYKDARPFFAAAIARARAIKASRITITPGTYYFRSIGARRLGHLEISGLSDLTIAGNGAKLIFTQNEPGLYLYANQRLKLSGFDISYDLPLTSIARVERRGSGPRLVISPQDGRSGHEPITYITEYDVKARQWVRGGQRLIFPPGHPDSPTPLGGGVYASEGWGFKTLKPDTNYLVFHYYYGGTAILIKDIFGLPYSEDLVVDGIRITSGPGMGIVANRMARGLAILRTRVEPDFASGNFASTLFDAIFVQDVGGDILIADNTISGQGDDAINLNGPVRKIVALNKSANTLDLMPAGRWVDKGHRLAFFSRDTGQLLGTAVATARAMVLTGGGGRITVDSLPPEINADSVVRDLDLAPRRYAMLRNKIGSCHCHGILAQAPHGIIADNSFAKMTYNAVRLLSSLTQWSEGTGAFNIRVENNDISDTGPDLALPFPVGAISLYGTTDQGLSDEPINDYVVISGNTIRNTEQSCISLASSRNVTVSDNRCTDVGAVSGEEILVGPGMNPQLLGNHIAPKNPD